MTGRLTALAIALAGLVALSGLADLARGSGLILINESRSLAPGLYRRAAGPPALGDLVVLDPPHNARPYLARLGAPPEVRLLKRIAAVEAAPVCARPGGVMVAGVLVPSAARDAARRPLPAWRGCGRLAADELDAVLEHEIDGATRLRRSAPTFSFLLPSG